MTIDYYVQEVRSIIREKYDDSVLDDRLIIRWINTQRALWIKNQVNNEYSLEDNVLQTIPCLEMEVASESECTLFNSLGRLLRTKLTIPKFLEFKDRLGIMDIRVPELTGYSLNISTREAIKYTGNGRYNSMDIFYFIYNSRVYVKIPANNFKAALLTYISVEGVYENPLALAGYYCNNLPVYDKEIHDYPINDALWEYMLGQILQSKFGIMQQQPNKAENNDSPES